jgi:predicted DNA-binding ribbon-helix-helix protein
MQEQATKTELEQIFFELLERLAAARELTDVNVAAGIALNELRGES